MVRWEPVWRTELSGSATGGVLTREQAVGLVAPLLVHNAGLDPRQPLLHPLSRGLFPCSPPSGSLNFPVASLSGAGENRPPVTLSQHGIFPAGWPWAVPVRQAPTGLGLQFFCRVASQTLQTGPHSL